MLIGFALFKAIILFITITSESISPRNLVYAEFFARITHQIRPIFICMTVGNIDYKQCVTSFYSGLTPQFR